MRNLLQQYFSISKKESTAIISLVLLIFIIRSGAYFLKTEVKKQPINKELEAIANTARSEEHTSELQSH